MPVLRLQLHIHGVVVVAAIVVNSIDRLPTAVAIDRKWACRIELVAVQVDALSGQVEIILRSQLGTFRADVTDCGHERLSQFTLDIQAPALKVRSDSAVAVDSLRRLAKKELAASGTERNRPGALLDGHGWRECVAQVKKRLVRIGCVDGGIKTDSGVPGRVPEHLVQELEATRLVEDSITPA